jgi:hypothetical protein
MRFYALGKILAEAETAALILAILQENWAVAERSLTEAQDRIGRLLREVGDKSRQAMLAPKPDQGDRG